MYNKHQTSLEDACLLLDVRCHVHAWQSHHTGKLKTIRFYGVCSLFLKSFISYYAFDIQSLQSTPRVQFSADKSFQTSSGTVSSLTTIRCLFLLLFGLLGAHNTQVHVKRQSFPLVLETEESDEEVLSGSGRTGSRWGNRASAPGLSPRERNQRRAPLPLPGVHVGRAWRRQRPLQTQWEREAAAQAVQIGRLCPHNVTERPPRRTWPAPQAEAVCMRKCSAVTLRMQHIRCSGNGPENIRAHPSLLTSGGPRSFYSIFVFILSFSS